MAKYIYLNIKYYRLAIANSKHVTKISLVQNSQTYR